MLDNKPYSTLQEILVTIPYLSQANSNLIEQISQHARAYSYQEGEVIFLEGEGETALYVVQSGWVKAVKLSTDGREQVLHFIGPSETFNAIGVLTQNYNPATVIALETTQIWAIPQHVILNMIDTYPELSRAMIQHLAQRVQQLIHMVEDFSLHTVESRLARYLVEYSQDNQLHRPRWATQSEMANRLGTVPDVLNRALRNLEKSKLIEVKRHRIDILNYNALVQKANLDDNT